MRIRIFSSRTLFGRRWYFQGRSDGNNKILFPSEGYRNHGDARATVEQIKREAGGALIDDSEFERKT